MEPYRVPLILDRTAAPRYRVVNAGPDPLRGVAVLVRGSRVNVATPPVPLAPRHAIEFELDASELEVDTTLFVQWLRPDGQDYVWRAVF